VDCVHGLGAAASSGTAGKGGGEEQGEARRGWGRQGGGDADDGVRHIAWLLEAGRQGKRSEEAVPGGTALSVRSAFVARCAACVYVGVYVGCRMIVRESEGREAKQGKEKRERRLRREWG